MAVLSRMSANYCRKLSYNFGHRKKNAGGNLKNQEMPLRKRIKCLTKCSIGNYILILGLHISTNKSEN
jgi:hypothetical protein